MSSGTPIPQASRRDVYKRQVQNGSVFRHVVADCRQGFLSTGKIGIVHNSQLDGLDYAGCKVQKKTYVEYLLDLFLYESEEEQRAWIAEHTAEITHLERRLKIMAENKPTNRERLREITDGIEPVSYTHLDVYKRQR